MSKEEEKKEPILELINVQKIYQMGSISVAALRGITFTVKKGEYVSIMGPSGCGKSTLLNLLGCLDRPTTGTYKLGGVDISTLDDDLLSSIRGERIGFIFQSYQLIQQLTVVENIELPLFYQGWPEDKSREVSVRLAQKVGLGDRLDHKPQELSGGQQQRVAIARALANDPIVIFADEATGNLDSTSGSEVLAIFDELHQQGKTLVSITHDSGVARRAERIVRLKDGEVESDLKVDKNIPQPV
jgi:putative ABC transport system ATP-binding protein